jgi:hypothetical protein
VLAGSGSAGGGPTPGLRTIRRNGAGAAVHAAERLHAGVATYFRLGRKGLCAQNDSSQPGSIRRKACVWGCAQPILGVGAARLSFPVRAPPSPSGASAQRGQVVEVPASQAR